MVIEKPTTATNRKPTLIKLHKGFHRKGSHND